MTVEVDHTYQIFLGNDFATSFPIEFASIKNASDLLLWVVTADGQNVVLPETAFSIEYDEDEISAITYPLSGPPLPTGHSLFAVRSTELLQKLDISNQDGFNPEVLEKALDKLQLQIQELNTDVSRSMKLPFGTPNSVPRTFPIAKPGRALIGMENGGYDPNGPNLVSIEQKLTAFSKRDPLNPLNLQDYFLADPPALREPAGVVRFDQEQNLTDEQIAQVIANLHLSPAGVTTAIDGGLA